MKSTTAFAAGTVLDEPVQDRQDKIALGAALRKHLDRYQAYSALGLKESTYDKLVGYDCLKFSGVSKQQRVAHGEIRMDDVEGFFCLHPCNDSFGVIIAAQNATTVYSDKVPHNSQVDHFFRSLTFTPLSSAVTRTIDVTTYPVGKAPSRVLSSNGRFWVVLKGENRIVEINPSDGSVIASVQAGKEPESIALGEKDLWVANSGDGTVTRINPLTKKAVAVIDVGGMPVSLTMRNGKIWVVSQTANEVVKIDPAPILLPAESPWDECRYGQLPGKTGSGSQIPGMEQWRLSIQPMNRQSESSQRAAVLLQSP